MSDDRKLYEYEPSELDFNMLINLQASLMAKLIITNKEVLNRYDQVLIHDGSVAGSEQIDKDTIRKTGERLDKITTVLEFELGRLDESWHLAKTPQPAAE